MAIARSDISPAFYQTMGIADKMRTASKRKLVDGVMVHWDVSIRLACKALKFDTSTCHYKYPSTGQARLEQRIKEICEMRVRYGYRRVVVLLSREGWLINMKRTRRNYATLSLQLPNTHPKRQVKAKLREDRQEAVGLNDVWAMDAVGTIP